MKIVAFVGSANKDGNTATAVKKIIEGLETKNIETELFYLTDYLIKPCTGCRYCENTNTCKIKDDDIALLHQAIRDCSGIILSTPTYYGDITGQYKQFVDRCYPFVKIIKNIEKQTMHFGSILEKNKPGILVAISGTHGEEVFDSHIKVTKHCFNDINATLWKSLLITNSTWLPVKKNQTILDRAYQLGIEFSAELQI